MRRKAALWATVAAAVTALACLAFLAIDWWEEYPGGMRSSYPARDYDRRLTRVAATARPLIEAISVYRQHLGLLPSDLAHLPGPPPSDGWWYTRDPNGQHYSLWRALGWDPSSR